MPSPKVVFDCMVFVQAAARRSGPARACLDAAMSGQIELVVSPEILAELHDVLVRSELRYRLSELTDALVARFLGEVLACSTLFDAVPAIYAHPLDKKDSPYIDLAIAAAAEWIVSRDQRHMLCLMDRSTPLGRDFTSRFSGIRVVRPEQLLEILRGFERQPG